MRASFEKYRRLSPLIIGIVLTLGVLFLGFYSAALPACYESSQGIVNCPSKWFYLKQSTPNELGDTLAGFAGALAFVWLMVTVVMQSSELSAQRKDIVETRGELVEQKVALQRSAAEAEHATFTEQLNTHLLVVATLIGISPLNSRFTDNSGITRLKKFQHESFDPKTKNIHMYLREMSFVYQQLVNEISDFHANKKINRFPSHKENYIDVLSLLNWVFENRKKMDDSQKAVLNTCRILNLRDGIGELLKSDSWHVNENARELVRFE